jgi:signal transduction histidine kinase
MLAEGNSQIEYRVSRFSWAFQVSQVKGRQVTQLVGGIVIGLLCGFPAAILVLRKSFRRTSASQQTTTPVQQQEQANRNSHILQLVELSKLTGELAHEIKNPLSTIKISLKLIGEELEGANAAELGGRGSDEYRQKLKRALRKIAVIEKETSRLEQILESFLRYIDRSEPQSARADINELVDDMIDFYSPQAYSRSITIRQSLHSGPLICKVDAGMLKQAMLNLFINAQQAMANGGELIVKTERRNDEAVIQISDTGSGIAPERLPNIFDAYRSSRPEGSGLGLPTTKKIVEANHGTIGVNSEPGKGTMFTIKLPLLTGDSP